MGFLGAMKSAFKPMNKMVGKVPGMNQLGGAVGKAPGMAPMGRAMGIGPSAPPPPMNRMNPGPPQPMPMGNRPQPMNQPEQEPAFKPNVIQAGPAEAQNDMSGYGNIGPQQAEEAPSMEMGKPFQGQMQAFGQNQVMQPGLGPRQNMMQQMMQKMGRR